MSGRLLYHHSPDEVWQIVLFIVNEYILRRIPWNFRSKLIVLLILLNNDF